MCGLVGIVGWAPLVGADHASQGLNGYDVETRTWIDLNSLQSGDVPEARSGHGLALGLDHLFCFGGMTAEGEHETLCI
jgi:hypothetical protein